MDLFRHFNDDDNPKNFANDNPKTEVRRIEFKKDKSQCEKYGIYPRSSKGFDDDSDKKGGEERLVSVKNIVYVLINLYFLGW